VVESHGLRWLSKGRWAGGRKGVTAGDSLAIERTGHWDIFDGRFTSRLGAEERLSGRRVPVFASRLPHDGAAPAGQDHKESREGEYGPNTGST